MTLPEFFQRYVVDQWTNFITQISGDHRYTHEGKGFCYYGKTASLAAAAIEYEEFVTPAAASGYVHMRPPVIASTANIAELVMTEAGTSSSGSAVTPRNKNRNSSTASVASLKTGVTLGAEGSIVVYQGIVGSSGNPAAVKGGQGSGADKELVLKANTKYVIKISNIGASTATVVYYELDWYEESHG